MWMPVPLEVAWRMRQAVARAWLAMPARMFGGEVGVGVVGGDDGEAGGGEEGLEAGGEGLGDVFFDGVVGELGAGVVAAVGGVEEDDVAGWLGGGGGLVYVEGLVFGGAARWCGVLGLHGA